ncbi:MAG: UDP-3-O-(3-hydroxymyristoyl)glucosamine N-acyltransferase [Myxococcales bacterium]|nr:UDP-3-O-(3-hydroxymyristoyl)glucosamine N-acyltransferase [Myxococcales bacterium]
MSTVLATTSGRRLPEPERASGIAQLVGGELHGEDLTILAVAAVHEAEASDLAYLDRGAPGRAGVLLARAAIPGRSVIVVDDPLSAMCLVLNALLPEESFVGCVHPGASVSPDAILDPGVVIGAGCVVGAGTHIFPNVVLYPRTKIGRNCRIHAGTVIGADGFRYHATQTGPLKVPHVMGVEIGDDVEIGANCTIDRGFLSNTTLGDGCKLDNMVHIGHNCALGKYVVIAAQTGVSGSCTIGDGAQIGGQVGVADHTTIGAGARIGAQSGLHGEIPAGETWLGTPALPISIMRRVYAMTKDLPAMWRSWAN